MDGIVLNGVTKSFGSKVAVKGLTTSAVPVKFMVFSVLTVQVRALL